MLEQVLNVLQYDGPELRYQSQADSWAATLEEATDSQQRAIAIKLINDIMFELSQGTLDMSFIKK